MKGLRGTAAGRALVSSIERETGSRTIGSGRAPRGPDASRAPEAPGPDIARARVVWLEDLLGARAATLRWFAVILAIAAAGVLILSVQGLYGLTSFDMELRRREIGIRRAVGARRRDIARLVFGNALLLTAAGAVGGLIVAVGLGRGVDLLIRGVEPLDLRLYAVLGLVLGCTALAGAIGPARRASRLSPSEAIRTG